MLINNTAKQYKGFTREQVKLLNKIIDDNQNKYFKNKWSKDMVAGEVKKDFTGLIKDLIDREDYQFASELLKDFRSILRTMTISVLMYIRDNSQKQ